MEAAAYIFNGVVYIGDSACVRTHRDRRSQSDSFLEDFNRAAVEKGDIVHYLYLDQEKIVVDDLYDEVFDLGGDALTDTAGMFYLPPIQLYGWVVEYPSDKQRQEVGFTEPLDLIVDIPFLQLRNNGIVPNLEKDRLEWNGAQYNFISQGNNNILFSRVISLRFGCRKVVPSYKTPVNV